MSSDLTTAPAQLSTEEAQVVGAVPKQLFIAGQWVDSGSGETLEVLDPATGAVICSVADATPEDGMAALDAAVAAQAGFAAMSPRSRSDILMTAFRLMHERIDDLALLMTGDGKPVAEAKGEITYAAEFFRHFAEEATRIDGGYLTAPAGNARLLVTKQPVGPTLLITPWNFPMAMGTRKLGPAIAAGCTSVIKPAHQTPLSMLALVEILREAGLPRASSMSSPACTQCRDGAAGPLGQGPQAVLHRLDPGRQDPPRTVRRPGAADLDGLGGNAPFIVFEDANLDEAVTGAMLAKMRNMGEACTAANRIYVHESIIGEFGERLSAAMAALPVGRGTVEGRAGRPADRPGGPGQGERARRGRRWQARRFSSGVRRPAAPATSTRRPSSPACPPRPRWPGRRSSARSPRSPPFSTEEEVIAAANDSEFGLVSYVFTNDLRRALRVGEALESGMVGINQGIVSNPAALRRDEAVRSGPRGRRGRHRRVPRDQVHRHRHVRMEA